MADSKKLNPPSKTSGDNVHATVRAALSLIPIAGGVATEIFSSVVTPPLERRRQKWMEDIATEIKNLENNSKITKEELQSNEAFIDCVTQASLIALRTHQQDKLDALRNAVVNSARPSAPEVAIQQMFLNFINDFNEWHLRLLKLFQNPKNNGVDISNVFAAGLSSVLEKAYPEIGAKRYFYDQIWTDLFQRGLTNTEDLHTTMSASGLLAKRTTEFGDQFINFIVPH